MPRYQAKLSDGRTVLLEADKPPSEQDVLAAVAQYKPEPKPDFKDLSAGQEPPISQPLMPATGEASTTYGGPPKQLASTKETMAEPGEMLMNPRVTLPRFEIKESDPIAVTVGKEALNFAAGLPEFATSNVGLMAPVAAAAAPMTTAAVFTVDMLKSLGEQVISTYENWDTMTPTQKAVAFTDMTGTGALVGMIGAGAKRHMESPAQKAGRAIGTEVNRAKMPDVEQAAAVMAKPNELVVAAQKAQGIAPMTAAAMKAQVDRATRMEQPKANELQVSPEVPAPAVPDSRMAPVSDAVKTVEGVEAVAKEAVVEKPAPVVEPAKVEPIVEAPKVAEVAKPEPVKPSAKDVYEVNFEAPSGERATVRVSKKNYSELSEEMRATVDREYQTTLQHSEKEFAQWEKIKEGKAKVTYWERVNEGGERSEHVSLEKPETEFESWALRDLHDKKLNQSGEQLRERLIAEREAKAKSDAEAETAKQAQKSAEDEAWNTYAAEVSATPLPKGTRGMLEVSTEKGNQLSLNGTQYGDWFLDKRDGKYKVSHVRSGLGVSGDGFLTRAEALDYIRAIIHSKANSKFSNRTQIPRPEYQKMLDVASSWRKTRKPPEFWNKPPTVAKSETVAGASPGPIMTPLKTIPSPTAPVKAVSQVVRDLSKGLGVPIRFGRLTTPKFGGYFKKTPNLIAVKYANAMPEISHEAGHKIETLFKLSSDPAISKELLVLGDPATPGSMSSWTPSKTRTYQLEEGMAEFVRHWMTEPAKAAKSAPNLYVKFEAALTAYPDLGALLRQAQADVMLWRSATPQARLRSSISTSSPNKVPYSQKNLTRDLVDDLHFLRLAVDDAKGGASISPTKNPYLRARVLRGSFGMAERFINRGIVDFKTRSVKRGTSIADAIEPLGNRISEFRDWIVAKRAKELIGRGKETGLIPSDVDFVVNKYNGDAAFQTAFDGIKKWNDGLLQYAVDSGLISKESAAKMRALNEDYVPFHRVFEVGAGETPAIEGSGTGRGLNVSTPGSLRKIGNSRRDIIDPLETMVKNAYALITASEKNAIHVALAEMAEKPGMGKWVEHVGSPKDLVRVELERIKEQLENAGADLTAVPDDLLMSFYRQSKQAPFGENIIKVNRDGKPEFYRLDKDLFETFHALDYEITGKLIRLMSAPSQLLRSGVTLTPDFALANALRDTVGSAVLSKYNVLPFESTLKGLAALMRNDKIVDEWAASGGKQSVEATFFDRAKMQKYLAQKIANNLTPAERAMVFAKSPLTALRLFTGTLEDATRIGHFKIAYEKLRKSGMPEGDARLQAAYDARDLQDFAKGGAQTKIIRQLAAFWNAQLQGNVRLYQSLKERPMQTIAKGLAFVTTAKILEQAVNWNDPDYWDRPQWERDLFFLIPFGKDDNGHTRFARIPTPFEVGVIFGTVPGRFFQWGKQNNLGAFDDLVGQMLKQTIPNPVPQLPLTIIESASGKQGYSFYRGRPIVPESLKDEAPELQYTEQTSLTARKIGELLGIPPAKVDYIVLGASGGVGKQLTHNVVDKVISATTGEQTTAKSVAPGMRFVATPAGVSSDAVEKFYKAVALIRSEASRGKAGKETTGIEAMRTQAESTVKQIGNLRKFAREEKDEKIRQQFNLEIALLASEFVKGYEEHQQILRSQAP
jgi:hypothetical protein